MVVQILGGGGDPDVDITGAANIGNTAVYKEEVAGVLNFRGLINLGTNDASHYELMAGATSTDVQIRRLEQGTGINLSLEGDGSIKITLTTTGILMQDGSNALTGRMTGVFFADSNYKYTEGTSGHASPSTGDRYYNTTDDQEYRWDGTEWLSLQTFQLTWGFENSVTYTANKSPTFHLPVTSTARQGPSPGFAYKIIGIAAESANDQANPHVNNGIRIYLDNVLQTTVNWSGSSTEIHDFTLSISATAVQRMMPFYIHSTASGASRLQVILYYKRKG
jgi:hypothetical protein